MRHEIPPSEKVRMLGTVVNAYTEDGVLVLEYEDGHQVHAGASLHHNHPIVWVRTQDPMDDFPYEEPSTFH